MGKDTDVRTYFNTHSDSTPHAPLAVRTVNALEKAKILTMDDLLEKSDKELKKVRNLGDKCRELAVFMREKYAAEINQN
jgi:DNA-directed RNA polymerase alpha subunit